MHTHAVIFSWKEVLESAESLPVLHCFIKELDCKTIKKLKQFIILEGLMSSVVVTKGTGGHAPLTHPIVFLNRKGPHVDFKMQRKGDVSV